MKALWLEDRMLSLRDVPVPREDGEALVRVRLSGICGTDLELARGYYPFTGVIGHEFVGEVEEAPDPAWVGERVVGDINASCGVCEACEAGRPTHCERRTVLGIVERGGAHAEYLTLPVANLHRVPDSVSDEAAVFTEPLAAAVEILEQVRVEAGDRVLLVGAGRLGQLVAQTLATTGANVAVVARREHQRALLAARHIRTIEEDEVTPARWDVVVEATGSPSGFELVRAAVRPRGTIVMKSTYRGELTLDMSSLVVDEVTIVGSRCGPFDPALELLESGDVDPVPMITKRFPLTWGVEAMETAAEPDVMKVLLEP
jgi:2-desacetyl-2-hydroxyethyl bacteriochlorophyllide A dehydrogenase